MNDAIPLVTGARAARPLHGLPAFIALALCTAGFTLWLLSRGYVSDAALWSWGTMAGRLDAEQGGLLQLASQYPPVPMFLLGLLACLPGLYSPLLPYFLSALLAAALLAHCNARLARSGAPDGWRRALLLLLLVNPALLWSASNGNGESLALALYYALALALVEMRATGEVRAYLGVSGVLALLALSDARSVYLAIALLPVVGLLVRPRTLRASPVAPKLVLYTPLAFGLALWLALHWFHAHQAPALIEEPRAPIGAQLSYDHLPWRAGVAGAFGPSTLASLGWSCLCYPVFLLLAPLRGRRVADVGLVLALAAVLATGLAMAAEFTRSPADMLVPVLGGVMALLGAGPPPPALRAPLVAALLLGNLGMALLFLREPPAGMPAWLDAVQGVASRTPHAGELALGTWARGVGDLMLDERSGAGVIAARGAGDGLVLGFSDAFALALGRGRLQSGWVAVPDPATDANDRINRRFPTLYEQGCSGYALAYDHQGWRVYRREDVPPAVRNASSTREVSHVPS